MDAKQEKIFFSHSTYMENMESSYFHGQDWDTILTVAKKEETMLVKTRKRYCGVLLLKTVAMVAMIITICTVAKINNYSSWWPRLKTILPGG